MRKKPSDYLNCCRYKIKERDILNFATQYGEDNIDGSINGVFKIRDFFIISSTFEGWDHVSVSKVHKGKMSKKIPSWEEMCYVKHLFFEEHETVIQFHPEESKYVNFHQGVLHLWRKIEGMIELPPIYLV